MQLSLSNYISQLFDEIEVEIVSSLLFAYEQHMMNIRHLF